MLETALAYLRHGWSIFPLRPKSKVPAIPSWRKFMYERATESLVCQWWESNPNWNVAIVTGAISGLFVVDCDTSQLVQAHEEQPDYKPTLKSITAHGAHFLYQSPGFRVVNRVGYGLDIRGDGGYIVAPPSIHPSGVRYRWQRAPIQTTPPRAILDLIQPKEELKHSATQNQQTFPPAAVRGTRYAQTVFDREYCNVISVPAGQRNNQLNRSAYNLGQLVGDGLLNRFDVENALLQGAVSVGLSEREALATIASGLNAGVGNPRSLRGR